MERKESRINVQHNVDRVLGSLCKCHFIHANSLQKRLFASILQMTKLRFREVK